MAENKYLDEHGLAVLADQVRIFRGTKGQWDLLNAAQKKLYSGAELTEDTLSGTLDVYSETETRTNKVWIDGKPIYRKVVDCGALPNNTTKNVDANIADMDAVVGITGFSSSSTSTITLPYIYDSSTYIEFYFNKTNSRVIIKASFNASTYYTTSYAIIEYTKTTD